MAHLSICILLYSTFSLKAKEYFIMAELRGMLVSVESDSARVSQCRVRHRALLASAEFSHIFSLDYAVCAVFYSAMTDLSLC